MNSIAELKSSLHHYIAETDDVQVLIKMQEYFQGLLHKGEEIVAYASDGRPLNQVDYEKDINEAIAQADKGEVISQEEMEKGL